MSRTYSTIESGVGASPPRVADLEAQNLALQVLVRVIANQVLEQESKLQTTHQGKGSLTQVREFKNGGREWQPGSHPEPVEVYDFPTSALGKATPYGVYDVTANEGWVNVGIDHDTAAFATESIRRWWFMMGEERYPEAQHLYITADGGGSNGSRNRLWKVSLQELANQTGLIIHVSHFPPGTSQWNKIEHRLFSFISLNWRGRALRTFETIVHCISNTRTTEGLTVRAGLDTQWYPTGIRIDDEAMARLNLEPDVFHPEWNYVIRPQTKVELKFLPQSIFNILGIHGIISQQFHRR